MPEPSRATTSGAVFQDIRKLARAQGRSTDELLVFYVLEAFFRRLSSSPHASRFLLKGGLLLATLDARRPTRDGDLLIEIARDRDGILSSIAEIAEIDVDDGVSFVPDEIRSDVIREGDQYEGLRVTMPARIASARVKLQLDVNFGDPVTPGPVETMYPTLLENGGFPIRGYPVETVLAEKLTTAITLGDANTRERDWADLWRLTGRHELAGSDIYLALERTASYRDVVLQPLSEAIERLSVIRAVAFSTWRRRQGVDAGYYPETFSSLVGDVVEFADPLVADGILQKVWEPAIRRWKRRARSTQADSRLE